MTRSSLLAAIVEQHASPHGGHRGGANFQGVAEALQCRRTEPVVVVEEENEPPPSKLQTCVAGMGSASVRIEDDWTHPIVSKRPQPLGRSIPRTIVDDDHLAGRIRLPRRAADRFLEKGQAIVGRDDHRDDWCRVLRASFFQILLAWSM
jgi:hypothetical protein